MCIPQSEGEIIDWKDKNHQKLAYDYLSLASSWTSVSSSNLNPCAQLVERPSTIIYIYIFQDFFLLHLPFILSFRLSSKNSDLSPFMLSDSAATCAHTLSDVFNRNYTTIWKVTASSSTNPCTWRQVTTTQCSSGTDTTMSSTWDSIKPNFCSIWI